MCAEIRFRSVFVKLLLLGAGLFHSHTFVHGQDISDSLGSSRESEAKKTLLELNLNQQQSDAIQIKMDSKGPIFVYGTSGGGQTAPPNGRNYQPKIQVFSDGKVVAVGSQGFPDMESSFSEKELTEFLDFVVNRNKFYQLDSDKIEKQIADQNKLSVLDANSSVFAIDLLKGKHEVEVYALWNVARRFPEMVEIKRLTAIEQRCKFEISRIHLGGDAEKVLQLVNKKLEELGMELSPFTLKEMRLASRMANGRFQVSFQRAVNDTDDDSTKSKQLHAIYYVNDAKSEPTVSFFGLPPKKQ